MYFGDKIGQFLGQINTSWLESDDCRLGKIAMHLYQLQRKPLNDEVEFMEEAEDLDEAELNAEMEGLIVLANEFYDREIGRYEE